MATPAPANKPDTGAAITALVQQLQQGGGASAGTQDYLGMPSNMASNESVVMADQAAQQAWAQGKTAPAYANGSQYLPVIQQWSPQDIATVQTRMVNTGLLSNTDYRAGVWDAQSQKAFAEVLGVANNMGRPWQDALQSYESGNAMVWDSKTNSYVKATPGTARTNSHVVTSFTNPDDLASAAQEVATNKLGRSFTPQELQKFITAYHGTEKAATTAQSASQDFTNPASMQTAATTFAEQTDPNAFAGEKFIAVANHFKDLIAGPSLATTKPMAV